MSLIQSLDWNNLTKELTSSDYKKFFTKVNENIDPFGGTYESLNPMFIAAKPNNSSIPIYHKARYGPNLEGCMDSMDSEYGEIQDDMKA